MDKERFWQENKWCYALENSGTDMHSTTSLVNKFTIQYKKYKNITTLEKSFVYDCLVSQDILNKTGNTLWKYVDFLVWKIYLVNVNCDFEILVGPAELPNPTHITMDSTSPE